MKKLFLAALFVCLATPAFAFKAPSMFDRFVVAADLSAEVDFDKESNEVIAHGMSPEGRLLIGLPFGRSWGVTSEFTVPVHKPSDLQLEDVGVRFGVGVILVK